MPARERFFIPRAQQLLQITNILVEFVLQLDISYLPGRLRTEYPTTSSPTFG